MIVVRFKVRCHPDRADQVLTAFQKVVLPSRALDGTVHFDIGRDVTDPNTFIATEVFEDRAALDRQESLPDVEAVVEQLGELLAEAPEATIYHVSSAEPWGQ